MYYTKIQLITPVPVSPQKKEHGPSGPAVSARVTLAGSWTIAKSRHGTPGWVDGVGDCLAKVTHMFCLPIIAFALFLWIWHSKEIQYIYIDIDIIMMIIYTYINIYIYYIYVCNYTLYAFVGWGSEDRSYRHSFVWSRAKDLGELTIYHNKAWWHSIPEFHPRGTCILGVCLSRDDEELHH